MPQSGIARSAPIRPPDLIHCAGCQNSWTGAQPCHCSGCHRTFTGIKAFDHHRVGGQCNDPSSLLTKAGQPRLVPVAKNYWTGWGEPDADTRWSE